MGPAAFQTPMTAEALLEFDAQQMATPAAAEDHGRAGRNEGSRTRAVVETFGTRASQINNLAMLSVPS